MLLPDIPKHQLKTEMSTKESGNPWLNMKSIDVGLKTHVNEDDDMGQVQNPPEVPINQKKKRNRRSDMGKSLDFTREKHMKNLAQSQ